MITDISLKAHQIDFINKIFSSQSVKFRLGVVNHDGFPTEEIPEVCFAGRSNVGKSSLINGITNRQNLARSSNTPGRTQELNYFTVDDVLHIVDLPGYGFAQAPKQKVDAWNVLIRDYLKGRVQLRRIFILIDCRHGIKKIDEEIFSMLDKTGVPYQIIVTKCDKISASQQKALLTQMQENIKKFIACHPNIIMTSAEKRWGMLEVQHEICLFTKQYQGL